MSIVLLLSAALLQAQSSAVSVGIRAGGQSCLVQSADQAISQWRGGLGGAAGVDVRYAYYTYLNYQVEMGFTTGLGVGCGSVPAIGTYNDAYLNTDYLGHQMPYTISSSLRASSSLVQGNIAFLMALRVGGLVINVGPKIQYNFAESRSTRLDETTITAYYPDYEVYVTNELITGYLPSPYTKDEPSSLGSLQLLVSAEIGWEWVLGRQSNQRLGVQAYADIGVWNNRKQVDSALPYIYVPPISDASDPVPIVSVGASSQLISSQQLVTFGVRAYYAFEFGSTKSKHRAGKDTFRHKNRIYIH